MAPQLSTLTDVLAGGDEASPAIFVGSGGLQLTRGELSKLIIQFAETLRRSGLKPGDVVTIAEPNTVSCQVLGKLEALRGRPAQLHGEEPMAALLALGSCCPRFWRLLQATGAGDLGPGSVEEAQLPCAGSLHWPCS